MSILDRDTSHVARIQGTLHFTTFEAVALVLDARNVERKKVMLYFKGTYTTHVAWVTMHVVSADVIKIKISLMVLNGSLKSHNGYILEPTYK